MGFQPGDEVHVLAPVEDFKHDWVFPGDRLFVVEIREGRPTRIRVRCPLSGADVWMDVDANVARAPSTNDRTLYERVGELERRVATLEDELADMKTEDGN